MKSILLRPFPHIALIFISLNFLIQKILTVASFWQCCHHTVAFITGLVITLVISKETSKAQDDTDKVYHCQDTEQVSLITIFCEPHFRYPLTAAAAMMSESVTGTLVSLLCCCWKRKVHSGQHTCLECRRTSSTLGPTLKHPWHIYQTSYCHHQRFIGIIEWS